MSLPNPPFTLPYTVTQEQIDQGEPVHGQNCPIARSIRAALDLHFPGHKLSVIVDGEQIFLYQRDRRFALTAKPDPANPPAFSLFARSFDRFLPVQPFSDSVLFLPRHPAD